jgi:hypothetical protein
LAPPSSLAWIASPAHEERLFVNLAECDDAFGFSIGNVVAVRVEPENAWCCVSYLRDLALVYFVSGNHSLAKLKVVLRILIARHKEGAAIIHVVQAVFGTPLLDGRLCRVLR